MEVEGNATRDVETTGSSQSCDQAGHTVSAGHSYPRSNKDVGLVPTGVTLVRDNYLGTEHILLGLVETGGIRQRVSVITLGVRDLARARRFYEVLGWETGAGSDDEVAFFQVGDVVLALWNRIKLAEDSCVEDAPGWGGVTVALNVGSREEVDAVTEEARAAGAVIGREPDATFWGGYSSMFIDPDGHPWEVTHNPHWTLTAEGGVRLPCAYAASKFALRAFGDVLRAEEPDLRVTRCTRAGPTPPCSARCGRPRAVTTSRNATCIPTR